MTDYPTDRSPETIDEIKAYLRHKMCNCKGDDCPYQEWLDELVDLSRKEMARELAAWIREVGYKLKSSMSAYLQVANKIDPDKVPSRNGLRSYWREDV